MIEIYGDKTIIKKETGQILAVIKVNDCFFENFKKTIIDVAKILRDEKFINEITTLAEAFEELNAKEQ